MKHFQYKSRRFLAVPVFILLGLGQPASAQNLRDDGFQRRNGQMSIVRHGALRPMTRDAHLPTGVVVTKDGFLIDPAGHRTELREGQGCDLRGRPVAVNEAQGHITLASAVPARPKSAPVMAVSNMEPSLLDELLGRPASGNGRGPGWLKKGKKGKHGRGRHKGH
jgi:hypothetical protein